jgi:hypothetical protein
MTSIPLFLQIREAAMKTLQQFLAISTFAVGAALVTGCSAFDSKPDADVHAGHHPAAALENADMAGPVADKPMQCKMAAAHTPEEHAAMKAECKKRMQNGMDMKGEQGGMQCDMCKCKEMMKNMDADAAK